MLPGVCSGVGSSGDSRGVAVTPVWDMRLGDCLHPQTGLASLGDKSVDHVITDPPYERECHGQQVRLSGDRGAAVKSIDVSFDAITESVRAGAAEQFGRIAKRWILAFCQIEGAPAWRAALEAAAARYIRTMIWVKPNGQPQMSGDRPGNGYEAIMVTHSKEATRWNGGGSLGWFSCPVDANFSREPRLHETQKPDAVMTRIVRDFTDPGELILDPFAGSGTTGVAAIRLGRRFIGWEKDPKYHAIAVKRLTAAREQLEFKVTA